jgi:alpha-glucosidase
VAGSNVFNIAASGVTSQGIVAAGGSSVTGLTLSGGAAAGTILASGATNSADELRQDPIWQRTAGADPGRDGCRVPLPWSGVEPPFGFSPAGTTSEPWLPQPKDWRDLTVQAESGNPDSMLELYRQALRIRRIEPALGDGPMTWLPAANGVLALDRGTSVRCIVNLSASPVRLPPHSAVILTSSPLSDGLLPPDGAAWLRIGTGA